MDTRAIDIAFITCIIVNIQPALAQSADSAKQFLESVYAAYTYNGNPSDIETTGKHAIASRSLIKLIQQDQLALKGEEGYLGMDPICQCQDFDLKITHIEVDMTGDDKAKAKVSFTNFNHPKEVKFDLLWSDAGWRIDDIRSRADQPSLREGLTKEIALNQGTPSARGSRDLAPTCLSATCYAQPSTATRLSHDIHMYGAKPVVHTLEHTKRFDTVLDNIASGNTDWIRLAPALADGTDAGSSMGLTIALAQALPINPKATLEVLDDGPIMAANAVCGVPFIEPTHREITTYLNKTIPAVTGVPESNQRPHRTACLKALLQARKENL